MGIETKKRVSYNSKKQTKNNGILKSKSVNMNS